MVGPRAQELLGSTELQAAAIVVPETDTSFEVLVPAPQGPAQWERLLEVAARLRIACVGLDALEHLAASGRFSGLPH